MIIPISYVSVLFLIQVYEYSKQLTSIGCFYLAFADSIKEADGERVLRCWRYLLPVYKGSGRTNYSIEALNLLCQHQFYLTPRQSSELIWSRFVNSSGLQGRKISLDLHQEHLNRTCKVAICGLQANKKEEAIDRVGKALGTLSPILENFDEENSIPAISGIHHIPKFDKDLKTIVQSLRRAKVFSKLANNRCHFSFPKPRDVLHSKDHTQLVQWIKEHLK